MNLSEHWKLITIRRLLCLFVFCIITAQSWSIFWSVLIRKRVRKPKDYSENGEGPIMVIDEKSVHIGALEYSEDELMGGPVKRTYSVDPSQYETEHFSVRPGTYLAIRPREGINEIFTPNISIFCDSLTNEDLDRLENPKKFINVYQGSLNSKLDVEEVNICLKALNQEISKSSPN